MFLRPRICRRAIPLSSGHKPGRELSLASGWEFTQTKATSAHSVAGVVKSDKVIFVNFFSSLQLLLQNEDTAVVYKDHPFIDGVIGRAVAVEKIARASGIYATFLDLSHGADLLMKYAKRRPSVVTALLLLPERDAIEIVEQVQAAERRWRPRLLLPGARRPERALRGASLHLDSQVYLLSPGGAPLREAYRARESAPLTVRRVAPGRRELTSRARLWRRRADLQGLQLRAATVGDGLDVIVLSTNPFEVTGFIYDVGKSLARSLNFLIVMKTPKDGEWGIINQHGCWTGIMGMVVRNETDIGMARLVLISERAEAVDFTTPISNDIMKVFIKEPKEYFEVGMRAVWSIVAALTTIVVAATAVMLVAKHFLPTRHESIWSLAFSVLYAFCQQGVSEEQSPRNATGRSILLLTQLAGFLVVSIYSATLISRLTVQQPYKIENFSEFVHTNKYTIVTGHGSANILILKSMEFDNYQLEYLPVGMQLACDGKHAQFSHTIVYPKISTTCKLVSIPLNRVAIPVAFALQKGSPYRDAINYQLMKMRESGDMDRLQRKWFAREDEGPEEPASINMEQVLPCLAVLMLGVVASLACLLVELWWSELNQPR